MIKKLSEKVEIINETVIRINDKEIITDKTSYEYEEIVSTLPATTFWTLYYQTKHLDFRSVPVTFVLSDEVPNVLSGVPFDLMYFIDNKYRYTRINAQNDKYLYEFSGKLTEEEIKKCLPKSAEILKYYVDEMGIIISNVNNIPPPRIRFISRFSMWNHKIKLNDVIKESKFSYSFNNIWNTQASFSKNFMDFNKLNNDEYVEQQTRDYLLHVMGEIAEVLEHTNYKKHKQKKELDRSGVKEELIDIQKYLLNLFLLYNVDVREFVELFNSKSKIVEERLKKEFKN